MDGISELRQNPATREWVIISTDRAKRPEEFGEGSTVITNESQLTCPFCPGREQNTPSEIVAYRPEGSSPNAPNWWIRVIPNMYPAVSPKGELDRKKVDKIFIKMDGVGEHEVIIETPDHFNIIPKMTVKQVEEIFLVYRERYLELAKNPRNESVIIFKNYGKNAGTSIIHSHSQIISTPIMPLHLRQKIEEAMRFFDDHGDCVYCNIIKEEAALKERVVFETENFIVLEPFAARTPFETWILPKKHESSFGSTGIESCKELAKAMQIILKKLHKSLNNPDYNYVIFSSPCHESELEYFHWHLKIYPRLAQMAGFELGSGIYINSVPPENATKYLKQTVVD